MSSAGLGRLLGLAFQGWSEKNDIRSVIKALKKEQGPCFLVHPGLQLSELSMTIDDVRTATHVLLIMEEFSFLGIIIGEVTLHPPPPGHKLDVEFTVMAGGGMCHWRQSQNSGLPVFLKGGKSS